MIVLLLCAIIFNRIKRVHFLVQMGFEDQEREMCFTALNIFDRQIMPQNIHTHNDEQHSLNGCTLNVKYIMKIHFINCSILTYFSYEKKRRNTSNFSITLIFIEFKTITAHEREKKGR